MTARWDLVNTPPLAVNPDIARALSGGIKPPKPSGITSIATQGHPTATVHIVDGSEGVDDGAHGGHDYDVKMHPAILGRLDAHGTRLDDHHDRITRLEEGAKSNLGVPVKEAHNG